MHPRRNPRRGRLRVFERMPAKSRTFFRFWDADMSMFEDVLVCPLSMYAVRVRLKPLALLGIYVPRSRRIYCDPRDSEVFLHEASHHVVSLHMPHLYRTPRGRAIEEVVSDIATIVATRRLEVPRGVGWMLIEMALRLKSCRKLLFDADGDPYLSSQCILLAIKARPKLITRLFF
jgi:hypothetical protein